MKERLTHKSKDRMEELQEQQANQRALEFESAEEMIRYDAARTAVPPSVGVRLARGLAQEQGIKATGPWWKRLFGKA